MKALWCTTAATLGVAFVLGISGTQQAIAADLPVYTPPPPAPVWSWTGPYAGLHVGTLDGDIDNDLETVASVDNFNGHSMDPNGIMGGIQAGYNFQFNSIVLGIEGDVSFGDVDDVVYPGVYNPSSGRVEAQMDWMATVRARLGWAMDRTLFYATGGVAFTDLEIKVADSVLDVNDSEKSSYFGWTVGGGVEHAVSDSISLKAEYLYTDFGKEGFSFFGGPTPEISGDVKLKTHTFRVGVNWLF